MSTFTFLTLALADVKFIYYLNVRINLIEHQPNRMNQSLHLSDIQKTKWKHTPRITTDMKKVN